MTHRFSAPTLALAATFAAATLNGQTTPKKSTPSAPARPAVGTSQAVPVDASPPTPVAGSASPRARDTERQPQAEPAAPSAQGVRTRFGITAAVAAPMSSLGQGFTAGYNGGVVAEGRPAGFPVHLRGDLQYSYFPGKQAIITADYAVLQLTGAASYTFKTASGKASPFYATGGIGLYRQSTSGRSQTDFGTNLGLGFNFAPARQRTFTEGRFHFFNDVEYFTLSLGFRL